MRTRLATPLSLILIEESTYDRGCLKDRLLRGGLLNNWCYECGIGPEWNNKPLSLQIDHINGIGNDNRIENLRILCPNCHAQTTNFGGKNVSIIKNDTIRYCIGCNKEIRNDSVRCVDCSNKCKGKIDWNQISNLKEMVDDYGFSEVGRRLGVSDNTVRKQFKKLIE